MRKGLIAAMVLAASQILADATEPRPLFDRRIGLFVHWGIYAAGEWHEQQQMRLKVPRAEYAKLAEKFDARRFDASALVAAARSAGAEYLVLTAKHHDGFCLWNTAETEFNVMNTPCGRDIVGEVSAACRDAGVLFGLYYSNPDWRHPNAFNPKSTHQLAAPEEGDEPDLARYLPYVRAQIRELMTGYGRIACLFWDISPHVTIPEMNDFVRSLQPGIMINDRGWGPGDYSTPERGVPEGAPYATPTEVCDSVGRQSWGYRANEDYRTVGYLTRAIDRALSLGGNFLLNIGPRADGSVPEEVLSRLAAVGRWHEKVGESFRGVESVPDLLPASTCLVTRRGRTLYLHFTKGLDATGVNLAPICSLPRAAVLLNTGARVAAELAVMPSDYAKRVTPVLHLKGLPADALANESVVVKLEFDHDVETCR